MPLGGRISCECLKAVVNACEQFFFDHKSSDPLVMDWSEIDFTDRSEHLHELLRWPSGLPEGTQYFLPLGSAPAD